MVIDINKKTLEVINSVSNRKDVKMGALKIYCALFLMRMRRNKFGYFPVPSEYMRKINSRYMRIIQHFIDNKIIKRYERQELVDNLFEPKHKKFYDVNKGICIKYKFLIDIDKAQFTINVPMKSERTYRWYSIIYSSLLEYGIEGSIKRDTYGRRVHHKALYNYREIFHGLWSIDSICSQPRLLFNEMKRRKIVDKNYFDIFENDLDFYDYLIEKVNLIDRDDAKSLFMSWAFGTGYSGDRIKHGVHMNNMNSLFRKVASFLKEIKELNYKDAGSYLQRIESKIWIDDLLNNLPVEFGVPIHDSLIVKEKDVDIVLEYCKQKYPDLRFKKQIIEYEESKPREKKIIENNLEWDDIWDEIKDIEN